MDTPEILGGNNTTLRTPHAEIVLSAVKSNRSSVKRQIGRQVRRDHKTRAEEGDRVALTR